VIVADASVLTPALVYEDELGRRTRARLAGEGLTAPALVDIEVISALRGLARRGRIAADRALRALRDLAALPLIRAEHSRLAQRIWELRDNLSPYDAAYVALAESLGTTLLTGDERLACAPGTRCGIEVLVFE
jgi:predicted nucleic acid-binding protein